ncbi:hypothetical protein BASA81_007825 [Batrachochytrium salamandrivorans]|nr:hypothetical protein BASA81_007825 [Batrachochytrium salamandrivorans]
MGDLSDMMHALPAAGFQTNVSLMDALPDPSLATSQIDFESKPSLLTSNVNAMSAAAQFAVLTHKKQEEEDIPAALVLKRTNRKRVKDAVPKKKQDKRARGKEIKSRSRGNQRA